MDLIDSDIFVLDLRYPNDPRHAANKSFLNNSRRDRITTIYNVLEVCGILSFNLNQEALLTLYTDFGQRYILTVLFPSVTTPEQNFAQIFAKISEKMTFGDAQILWTAEQHEQVKRIITWNTKDFVDRTALQVMTPDEWLAEGATESASE